jgi:hypothetical protein
LTIHGLQLQCNIKYPKIDEKYSLCYNISVYD